MVKGLGFGFTESAVQISPPGEPSCEAPGRSLILPEPVSACALEALKHRVRPVAGAPQTGATVLPGAWLFL